MNERLTFSVLGPVRAWQERTEMRLGPPQQRLTFAVLLLNTDHFVSVEKLLDAVWGEEPPRSAVNSVRIYVHRIRRLLSEHGHPKMIMSVGSGYELLDQGQQLDLSDFESLTAKAERARYVDDRASAVQFIRDGLELWQGPPLAELAGDWAQKQRRRIEDLHLASVEAQATDLLALGQPAAAVDTIGSVACDHPFDERIRELLMLAMHQSGRTAEALNIYRETREMFARELGIDVGEPLRRLHVRLLQGS